MAISDWQKITREEFGLDLYDCIQKFSERQWVRTMLRRIDMHALKTVTLLQHGVCTKAKLRQIEASLTQEITALMPKLQPADVKRLLDKYETKGAA